MSDGENIFDKQLIIEVCDSLTEEKKMVPQQGFFSSLFGSKHKVEEEKVEEEKVEEEKVDEEKVDCDDLLMNMKKCIEDKEDSTQCHETTDKWEHLCNSRSWFEN